MTSRDLHAVRIDPLRAADVDALAAFFEEIAADAEAAGFFHPHPLTRAHAAHLCGSAGARKDGYWLARLGDEAVGYSMLRGWDEGFAVPSFGGCVRATARGAGLGHLLLEHAIAAARAAGASRLRLSVFRANARAVHVYTKFGFVFEDKNPHELVGWLDLAAAATSRPRPAGRVSA